MKPIHHKKTEDIATRYHFLRGHSREQPGGIYFMLHQPKHAYLLTKCLIGISLNNLGSLIGLTWGVKLGGVLK